MRKYILLALIPDVQEIGVAGSHNIAVAFVDGAIERGPYVFLALLQVRQWHPHSYSFRELIEVRENLGHDLLVLSISTLWNIDLRHRLEVHRQFADAAHRGLLCRCKTLT